MNCADYKTEDIRYSEEYNVFVSRKGDIWNMNGKKLKAFKNTRGYMIIEVGNKSLKRVHRIIAKTFIPNPLNKREVNHIDGNKENNSADNLEWVTRAENMNCYYNSPLSTSKSIASYSNGVLVKKYQSMNEAKKEGYTPADVYACCIGVRKHHKGLSWQYC